MSPKSSAEKNKPVPLAPRRAASSGKTPGSSRSSAARDRLPIVGLGASAGGLEALRTFFGAMPPKTGLSFVIVVHLDPTHESLMPELLAKSTTLAVHQAQDRQPLEADHVYIIPPTERSRLTRG
jgi:two-component system, chemotaxis family, CheB/CheR fusion protein